MKKKSKILILLSLLVVTFIAVIYTYKSLEVSNSYTLDEDGNLVFEITNKSFKSVYYYGYGKGLPLYKFATKKNNTWTPIKRGYCGTGVKWVELKRNQTVNVVVNKSDIPKKDWKLGIPCQSTKNNYLYEYLNIDIDPYLWSEQIKKKNLTKK